MGGHQPEKVPLFNCLNDKKQVPRILMVERGLVSSRELGCKP